VASDTVRRVVQPCHGGRYRAVYQRAVPVLVLPHRSGRHAAERKGDDEERDADNAHLPAVHHLAGEEPHQGEHHDAERNVRTRGQGGRQDPDERTGQQHQVEEHKHEQDHARAGSDEPVRDRRQAVAVVPHRDHDGGIVAHPADEADAQDQPDQRGRPPPEICGGDWSHDGPSGRDRLEVIPEEDVPAGRHEVDAVHVHPGRRRPLGVGLDDVPVDAFGLQVVSQINSQHAEDDDPEAAHNSAPSSIE
jgi:hypothetical protein